MGEQMRVVISAAIVACVAVQLAAPAFAESNLTGKKYGMSFLVPTGSKSTAGLLYIMDDKKLLELDFGLAWKDKGGKDDEGTWGLLLAPGLRYYLMTKGDIGVYFKGLLQFAKNKDQDASMGVFGGLGVEWWVTEEFSLCGDTGASIDLIPDENLGLNTLSHGFSANLYW